MQTTLHDFGRLCFVLVFVSALGSERAVHSAAPAPVSSEQKLHVRVPERELLVVRLDTGRLEALVPVLAPVPAGSQPLGKIVIPQDTPPGTILSLYRTREGGLFVLLGDQIPAGAESLGGVAVPPYP